MAFEDNATTGETRSAHPSVLAAASPGERRWWQSGFWAHMLGILFLFGFLQYWVHEFLEASGVLGLGPSGGIRDVVAGCSGLIHLPSLGGLIGYAVSRRRIRGSLIGAIIGLIVESLML